MIDWQPIDTAPKDGTEVLVYLDMASVGVVHIAWWEDGEPKAWQEDGEAMDAGWWSYTTNSVGQDMLCDYRTPIYWAPYNKPPGQ